MSTADFSSETATEAPATHQTAETRFVDASAARFAFRRFGARGTTPLMMLQHFRRLVLAATGPKGGPGMHGWREDIAERARSPETSGEALLYIFFAHTDTSPAKGMEFLGRFMTRAKDRDPPTSLALR